MHRTTGEKPTWEGHALCEPLCDTLEKATLWAVGGQWRPGAQGREKMRLASGCRMRCCGIYRDGGRTALNVPVSGTRPLCNGEFYAVSPQQEVQTESSATLALQFHFYLRFSPPSYSTQRNHPMEIFPKYTGV